jgi:phenylacetate-CoA ligase
MPDSDAARPFWDGDAQTRPNEDLQRLSSQGLAREWARVWEVPVPFYRERYEAAGLSEGVMPDLDDIPLTTKDDLRANEAAHPPFGTHRTIGLRDAVRIGGSTGTSGTPVVLMFGPKDLEVATELQCRVLWRYGVRPGDAFTHSWPQGFYSSSTSTAVWFLKSGILEMPVGPPVDTTVAADHLRLWQRLGPAGFQMTGSQLQIYEEAAAQTGIDLSEIFAGKAIGLLDAIFQFEGPRKRIEQKYGFDLRNMGGVGDICGYGLTDCHHHTGLHAPGDYSVVQIVDPATGKSLPEGERGHVVLSIFGFDGLVLRYDIEDICTMSTAPCPCGETGPRYTLLGRAIDVVTVGEHHLLPIDAQLVLDEHESPEFQLAARAEQTGRSLRIRIEGDGDASRYQGVLEESLGVPVEVEEVPLQSLPRSSWKPRRIST